VFTFLPFLTCYVYAKLQPKPTMQFTRDRMFHVFAVVFLLTGLPILIIGILWPIIVQFATFLFWLPYVILFGRTGTVRRNFAMLRPSFQMGDWSYTNLFIAVTGSQWRQGFLEYWLTFTQKSLLLVPIIKYVLICNPWAYELREIYTNQWTDKLPLEEEEIAAGALRITSWALHGAKNRRIVDEHIFSVYYPIPESWRSTVGTIGVQSPTGSLKRNVLLITDTKHRHLDYGGPTKPSIANRSTISKMALFEVNLYYWNPYHHLTGVVEVNITKDHEVEHPFWCMAGKDSFISPLLADLSEYFFEYGKEASRFVKGFNENQGAGTSLEMIRQRSLKSRASRASVKIADDAEAGSSLLSQNPTPEDKKDSELPV